MMKLLKVKEAAEMFRVNPQTIFRLVKQKKIPFIKIGGSIRIKEQDVKTILNGSSKETKTEGKDLRGVYIVLDANDKIIKVFNRQDRAKYYSHDVKKDEKTYVKWFRVFTNITR